jgi:hypothetical protein
MPIFLSVARKIISIILLLAMSTVAAGLQLDRASRKNERLAYFVPPQFRGYALEVLARDSYAEGHVPQGLAYSRELVLRRPVPAENLSLLTRGYLLSGQQKSALSTLILSAQRGWRDNYTQNLMIVSAMQVGDITTASQRLLALWRSGNFSGTTKNLTSEFMKIDQGGIQFSRGILASDGLWSTTFLAWGSDHLSDGVLQSISKSMAAAKTKVDCAQIATQVGNLVQLGRPKVASAIWFRVCSTESSTGPTDFRFKSPANIPGPFDWFFPAHAGLEVETTIDRLGERLKYNNAGEVRVSLAEKNSELAPGDYMLSQINPEGTDKSNDLISLHITCYPQRNTMDIKNFSSNSFGNRDIIAVPVGCISQKFSFWVAPGKGSVGRLVVQPIAPSIP